MLTTQHDDRNKGRYGISAEESQRIKLQDGTRTKHEENQDHVN